MDTPLKLTQKVVFNSQNYFLRKRSFYSDVEAIKSISKFGISKVIDIDANFVLEEFINFKKIDLSLDEYIPLLQKIHSHMKNNLILVHGDFSKYNTTNFNSKPVVMDYEHAHWGNIYEDLGRIILRETSSVENSLNFLESYFNQIPNKKELRDGVLAFCYWQNKIRLEKSLPYAHIPLKRAKRVLLADNSYKSILNSFRSQI